MQQRDISIDCAKGLAIIAMVLGHAIGFPYIAFCYSFHMPLFFILAGYFFHEKTIVFSLSSDFRRLLIPYLLFTIIFAIKFSIPLVMQSDWEGALMCWIRVLWAGDPVNPNRVIWGGIRGINIIWFLPAMFWCKNIYNVISILISSSLSRLIVSLILSLLSIYIFDYIINLPFGLLMGGTAVIFYAIGNAVRKTKNIRLGIKISSIICWMLSFMYFKMNMVEGRYENIIVNIYGACGGTLCVCALARFLCEYIKWFGLLISWFGKFSMIIMCIHFLNSIIDIQNRFQADTWQAKILIEFLIIIPMTLFCIHFPPSKKIFQIK